MERVFNFSAGPAMIAKSVLEKARDELVSYPGKGMSVMEMSHRSCMYVDIFNETKALLQKLMNIPEEYEILFLQGGATLQFSAVPLNLLTGSGKADYVDSGNFAHLAMEEAKRYGTVKMVASSREENYTYVPDVDQIQWNADADYAYITTNNTIYGTKYAVLPETGNVPLVADMSSNILSEPYDVSKFGLIFAGAQKNIGPAGFALTIVRRDLIGRAMAITPKVLDYKKLDDAGSMLNTPPTYAIYMAGLCLKWLKKQGGVEGIAEVNREKASWLYDCIDNSRIFKGVAEKESRSIMNVTFRTGNEDLDAEFVKAATKAGLVNIKGHRSVGGMRASIYNAMPPEGVRALVEFMKKFEMEHK